ncbi:MAG: nuclear transport factor 2 family protein [Candidatus Heimdallarchaeaceae archaeon]
MNSEDIDLVNQTLNIYFEGNQELDAGKILSVWDEDLKIISTEKTLGPQAWIEMAEYYRKEIDNDMSKWDIDFEIVTMDVFKSCASVRLDVKYILNTREFSETQFLHLLKKDGSWLIYSKIFVFY